MTARVPIPFPEGSDAPTRRPPGSMVVVTDGEGTAHGTRGSDRPCQWCRNAYQ